MKPWILLNSHRFWEGKSESDWFYSGPGELTPLQAMSTELNPFPGPDEGKEHPFSFGKLCHLCRLSCLSETAQWQKKHNISNLSGLVTGSDLPSLSNGRDQGIIFIFLGLDLFWNSSSELWLEFRVVRSNWNIWNFIHLHIHAQMRTQN